MINIDIITKSTPVVVACSGGVDSVTLAHLLIVNKYNVRGIAHFHHNYQPINEQMATSVAKLADYYNVPLISKKRRADPITAGVSVEATLRSERMAFFNMLDSIVVTGHHLNDCVESHFMNFIRGHEERAPIPPVTKLDGGGFLVRPIILNTKSEIEEYAKRANLNDFIVEDPTNKDSSEARRNWLRNEIIPLFPKELGMETIVYKKMVRSVKEGKELLESRFDV